MARGYGSLVPAAVFEVISPVLEQRLQEYVTNAASRFCPHIRVLNVSMTTDGASSERAVILTISFTPADEKTQQTRSVKLDRSAVLRAIGGISIT